MSGGRFAVRLLFLAVFLVGLLLGLVGGLRLLGLLALIGLGLATERERSRRTGGGQRRCQRRQRDEHVNAHDREESGDFHSRFPASAAARRQAAEIATG